MKSRQILRPERQKHQRTRKLMPKLYLEKKKRDSSINYIKAQEYWQRKYKQIKTNPEEARKTFDSSWSWYQIKSYIIKMLRIIKENLK